MRMRLHSFSSMMKGRHMMTKYLIGTTKYGILLRILGVISAAVVVASGLQMSFKQSSSVLAGGAGNWPTYMGGNEHKGFNKFETMLNANSARNLKLHWVYKAGGWISSQVIIVNGTLYWGAADGYEYAMDLNGQVLWRTFLGSIPTAPPLCFPTSAGVTAPATVSTVAIRGKKTSVVFVGGGDAQLYALNAANGSIIWHTALGIPPNMMIWAGASIYNGSLYIGRASYGDCPLEPGEFFQINASTGAIEHSFVTVPAGCVGGGIWMTPTVDEMHGTVYVATGTIHSCSTYESYAYALLEFDARTLTLLHAWQVPKDQQGNDDDFGSTPTLFAAVINGAVHDMIGLVNKNGIYYALDRADISAGPLWETRVSTPAPNARSSISSSAWDEKSIYIGDSHTTIGSQECLGSMRALNPATGNILWEDCLPGKVQGSAMVVPGVVAIGSGAFLYVLDARTGATLFSYHDPSPVSLFWGTPTISNGMLYIGNKDGSLFAFGL